MARKAGLEVVGERKPRERKSLAARIAELKETKAAHEARAEAVETKIQALLAEHKEKAEATLAAVREARES